MTPDRRCLAALLTAMLITGGVRAAGAQTHGMGDHLGEMRWGNTLFVLLDELEYAPGSAGRPVSLDARLWYGGALNRIWVKAEADQFTTIAGDPGDGELHLLYGRLVHPFWDAVIGVRADRSWGGASTGRAHLAFGLIGLAPYRFELEPTLFVSERGDLSARLAAEYPVLVTQRLVAEPTVEVNAALQRVPEFGVRSGLNDYEIGLRIRYEIRREFAPYIGWTRKTRVGGSTSTDPDAATRFVTGLRLWY